MRTTRARMLESFAAADIAARPGAYGPDAIVLEDGIDPQRLPGFEQGELTPQGEASQLVALMTGVQAGDTVWDACAAPGGKATALAEIMRGEGRVIATDVNEGGLAQLRQTSARLGLTNITAIVADAAAEHDLGAVPRVVDVALVDAPCSGLGTLRQHPEIRWRRTATDLVAAAQRQRALLTAVAQRVRSGGALVYATCTITQIENDDVIAAFLAGHPDFTIVDPRPSLPREAHALVDAAQRLRTWPHRHALEGFFAVRLLRR
jgi:16S rRNA (cytosine967-C5)-methyltransferase